MMQCRGIMAEQSKSSEKHEQQKMLLQNFQFDTVKPQMRSSGSMPNSPIALRKSTSVRQNCLCSPTTHVGSFRCRYHRSTNMTRNSMSVGAKLSDLAEKQSDMIIKSATWIIRWGSHNSDCLDEFYLVTCLVCWFGFVSTTRLTVTSICSYWSYVLNSLFGFSLNCWIVIKFMWLFKYWTVNWVLLKEFDCLMEMM